MARSLEKQAEEILRQARKTGLKSNFFFSTTFARYMQQLKMLRELQGAIDEHGPLVQKEYVKGRVNVVTNPAIADYNKTATAANGTVTTLINILKTLSEEDESKSDLKKLIDSLNADDG